MPIYDYECGECKALTTSLQKADITMVKCEKCGKIAKRIIGAPHIQVFGFNAKNGYSHTNGLMPVKK